MKLKETSGRLPLFAIVAVIDTGVDLNHPMLRDHIWSNPKEIANGIDDDGNGLVDDLHGWNFATDSRDTRDDHGHGTHIAGIITQQALDVKIMVLKYFDRRISGPKQIQATASAIRYAIKMGADIINYSAGGTFPDPEEYRALKEAEDRGVLIVAAAGNNHANNDQSGYFPANYPLSNIISVGALKQSNELIPESNYGEHTVDIAAPGHEILSAAPGGSMTKMSGTSQATAHVSGVVARLLGSKPGLKGAVRLVPQILGSAQRSEKLLRSVLRGSTSDLTRAISMAEINQSPRGVKLVPLDSPFDLSQIDDLSQNQHRDPSDRRPSAH